MTFTINLGPVVEFFQQFPNNAIQIIGNMNPMFYYLICAWVLSLFLVPPQLKSIGSVATAPLWLPFFVLARGFNFVMAAKRGGSIAALTESINRTVTGLEGLAVKLQDNQKNLDSKVGEFSAMVDENQKTVEKLERGMSYNSNTLTQVNNQLKAQDNTNLIQKVNLLIERINSAIASKPQDKSVLEIMQTKVNELYNSLAAMVRSHQTNQNVSINTLLVKVEELSKKLTTNTKLENMVVGLINQVALVHDKVTSLKEHVNKPAVKSEYLRSGFEVFRKMIMDICVGKPDDFYVSVGLLGGDEKSASFQYKMGLKLGAIRAGVINADDIWESPKNSAGQLTATKNGLPVVKTTPEKNTVTPVANTQPVPQTTNQNKPAEVKVEPKVEPKTEQKAANLKKVTFNISDEQFLAELNKLVG